MTTFFKFLLTLITISFFSCAVSKQETLQLKDAPVSFPQGDQASALEATYESINKHVFLKTCKNCHSLDGDGKRVLLDKDSLLNSPLELIIPGNPDESGLVIDLERKDDKRMPPEDEGYDALPQSTIAVIRKWIENGAKD